MRCRINAFGNLILANGAQSLRARQLSRFCPCWSNCRSMFSLIPVVSPVRVFQQGEKCNQNKVLYVLRHLVANLCIKLEFCFFSLQASSAAASSANAAPSGVTPSAPEIKKERLDTAAGTSSQNSTNASQSTSSASPTVVTAVKSEPDAGKTNF